MQAKGEIELDTAINSPTKRSIDQNQYSKIQKDYVCGNSFINQSSGKMSQTEIVIYSHQLIHEVMKSSKNKTIWHNINRINQNKPLYSKPIKFEQSQFKFDSIPLRNKLYASQCSAKIKKIKDELSQTDANSSKNIQNKKNIDCEILKKRPSSVSRRIDTKNPKVNVTGLVSYNFNSVNARNSLGFSRVNRQEKLIKQIEKNDQKRFCSLKRFDNILEKTSARRFLKHTKNQNAIMSDFISDTDSYLCVINREKQGNTLIYNQCAKKINLIKQYMEQQKTNYEDASFIVNQIESSQKVKNVKQIVIAKKGELNDEKSLNNRRMPIQNKPLMVKHFAFTE